MKTNKTQPRGKRSRNETPITSIEGKVVRYSLEEMLIELKTDYREAGGSEKIRQKDIAALFKHKRKKNAENKK